MSGYPPRAVTRSLVAPGALYPGAVFLVPVLEAGPGAWWTVARTVDLPDCDRVRLILAHTDRRGRAYRLEIDSADCVVWASTAAPAALAVPRLGHRLACPQCRAPWGYLPVTACDALCFRCARGARVGI